SSAILALVWMNGCQHAQPWRLICASHRCVSAVASPITSGGARTRPTKSQRSAARGREENGAPMSVRANLARSGGTQTWNPAPGKGSAAAAIGRGGLAAAMYSTIARMPWDSSSDRAIWASKSEAYQATDSHRPASCRLRPITDHGLCLEVCDEKCELLLAVDAGAPRGSQQLDELAMHEDRAHRGPRRRVGPVLLLGHPEAVQRRLEHGLILWGRAGVQFPLLRDEGGDLVVAHEDAPACRLAIREHFGDRLVQSLLTCPSRRYAVLLDRCLVHRDRALADADTVDDERGPFGAGAHDADRVSEVADPVKDAAARDRGGRDREQHQQDRRQRDVQARHQGPAPLRCRLACWRGQPRALRRKRKTVEIREERHKTALSRHVHPPAASWRAPGSESR